MVVRQPPATLLLRHEGLAGSVDVAGLRILELQPRQSDLVRGRDRGKGRGRGRGRGRARARVRFYGYGYGYG